MKLLPLALILTLAVAAHTQTTPNELAWAVHTDPKTLDPQKVEDPTADLLRYLTGGVLIRLNRATLALEPQLADSFQITSDGKLVTLHLRPGLRFSDGSSLTAADAVATLQRVLLPATAAPVADEFLQPAKVTVDAPDPLTLRLHLPVRIVSIASVLDEIPIEPAHRLTESKVTAGPFTLAEYRKGEFLRLQRNPFFYQKDPHGTPLPYLQSLRLDILANRDTEELRFLRGQYGLLESVPPETFAALNRRLPGAAHDLGPSLNTEQMWFNQSPRAPLPAFEKHWFISRAFRAAVSLALHRADLARIAYDGHATPANGFISPANTTWYNRALPPVHEDPKAALNLLAAEGFQLRNNQLFDRENHPVAFSLLTNAGNRPRERMATLIQQDLAALGIRVNVVTLDFPALIDRLMHTLDYEAALLGPGNIQPDPSSQMNLWLSHSPTHQFNPSEPTPATPWEAEIDAAFLQQDQTGDLQKRKAAIDRIQTIVAGQLPFIYLVYPNTLCAVGSNVLGARLSVLTPNVVSDIQAIHLRGDRH